MDLMDVFFWNKTGGFRFIGPKNEGDAHQSAKKNAATSAEVVIR